MTERSTTVRGGVLSAEESPTDDGAGGSTAGHSTFDDIEITAGKMLVLMVSAAQAGLHRYPTPLQVRQPRGGIALKAVVDTAASAEGGKCLMVRNGYKDAVYSYCSLTQRAVDEISPSGKNSCQNACNSVSEEKAWVSPAADQWVEEIGEIGARLSSAFTQQDQVAEEAYEEEPEEVEEGDWRASWTAPLTPVNGPK